MITYYITQHPFITIGLILWFIISCRLIYLNGDWPGIIIVPILAFIVFILGGWKLLTPIIDMPTKNSFGNSNLLTTVIICCIPAILITGPIALISYIHFRWHMYYDKSNNRTPKRKSIIDPIIDYFKLKSL